MTFKKPTKFEVMTYLDGIESILDKKSMPEMIRKKFGFSWPLSHAYVQVWVDEKNILDTAQKEGRI